MKFCLLIFSFLIISIQTFSQNEKKHIALLIGNSSYSNSPIKSPANDAVLLAEELRKRGFEVMLCTNLDIREMKIKMEEFEIKLNQYKGIGLFFYSGYGIQLNGENYLIPLGARIDKQQDVEMEAISLQKLIENMQFANTSLNLVILDASRENPFSKLIKTKTSGLAIIEPPTGTMIAYSTTPGNISVESNRDNSLYMRELVKALQIPNLKIEEVFKKVRKEVYQKTKGRQSTWENECLFGDFYF
jgi:uncharacterized caspase-like protein